MALEVMAAGEWVDDIKAGIIDDEWFGPIGHCLGNPSPRPSPSTASTKERTFWVAVQRLYVEENRLLWLRGDLEKIQVNRTENEEYGKADMRGRLSIRRTMEPRILQQSHNTPAGGHFGEDRTYLRMKEGNFWDQLWRDTQ